MGSGITAEFYNATALRHVDFRNSLEDSGIYFRVVAVLLVISTAWGARDVIGEQPRPRSLRHLRGDALFKLRR
jgi:hypothetical protein